MRKPTIPAALLLMGTLVSGCNMGAPACNDDQCGPVTEEEGLEIDIDIDRPKSKPYVPKPPTTRRK